MLKFKHRKDTINKVNRHAIFLAEDFCKVYNKTNYSSPILKMLTNETTHTKLNRKIGRGYKEVIHRKGKNNYLINI